MHGRRPNPRGLIPVGQAYQQQIALGQVAAAAAAARQQQRPVVAAGDIENDPRFTKIPAWYVCTISLAGTVGATGPGNAQLRPELFVLKRISWATTGDVYPYADSYPGFSIQARSVTLSWSDEFTKFMGNSPGLVASVFGDSNGFLDLPRAALFQGSQTLGLTLTRLFWPSQLAAAVTRWDFVFTGFGLLPRGVNQSGTAG